MMEKLRTVLVGFALAGAVASMPAATSAGPFNAAYLFGDSLSDAGNTFNGTAGAFPPDPPYFNGRVSNGPVWSDHLFGKLSLAPPLVTTLPGPPVTDGIDFAFAGATTGTLNVVHPSLPGIQNQVGQFNALTGGGAAAQADAIYIVWGGANDYIGGGVTDPTIPIGNLSGIITDLHGSGARDFLVLNLPDLGRIPRATALGPAVSAGLTALSLGHNALLAGALGGLGLLPDINLLTFDIQALFDDALANPGLFGLTNITDPCLTTACADPDAHLFWDDIHPTAAMHTIIAERVFATLAVPEPGTLALFGASLGGLGFLRRKRPARGPAPAAGSCDGALARHPALAFGVLGVLHTIGVIYGFSKGGVLLLLGWFGLVMLAGMGLVIVIGLRSREPRPHDRPGDGTTAGFRTQAAGLAWRPRTG